MGKKPALRPGQAVGEGLAAVARDIVAEAERAVSDTALSSDDAIHDFRKAVKRWRAFLRLAKPFAGNAADTLRAESGEHARTLGIARDLRAARDAMEDTKSERGEIGATAYRTIAKRIEALQDQTEGSGITAERRAELRGAIARWAAVADQWPYDNASSAQITAALAKGYRRARRAAPDDWHDTGDGDLHEFRRRVIDHRYQMELVQPLWPKLGKLWVQETQKLRDALGQHRDLGNLAMLTGPKQPLARYRSRLVPLIERRQAAHLNAARKLAARIFAEKPKAFEARVAALWHPQRAGKPKK